MPELPEVQTVVNDLNKSIKGLTIKNVLISNRLIWREKRSRKTILRDKRILDVFRKGKNILIHLSDEQTLIVHLKMTGKLIYTTSKIDFPKHTHFAAELSKGFLYFNDIRRFGYFNLIRTGKLDEVSFLMSLGPDPFEIDKADFVKLLKSKNRKIKTLLMDQTVISGLGNIYVDESLFAAKIHPLRKGSRISSRKLDTLFEIIIDILKKAIKARGSSISDYVDGSGSTGEFQLSHKVYGHEGVPCPACGGKIKREVIAGRSAHFCPRCQRL